MPTVSDIAKQVALQLGEASDLETMTVFEEWVVESIDELLAEGNWPFSRSSETIATVAGTHLYTLTAPAADIRQLYIASKDLVLEYTTEDELHRHGLDVDSSGTPSHWWVAGSDGTEPNKTVVGLWKKPDSVLTITAYTNTRADSLTSSSVVPLPSEAVRAVKQLVRQQFLLHTGSLDAADRIRALYTNTLRQLRARYENREAAVYRFQVRDVSAGSPLAYNLPETITP